MALPTLTVEFAPASTLLATAPTWVDITTYVLEFEVNRGFSGELDTVAQAGTATIVLDNRDRRFDPTYAAGPYFGNLNPGKQVRIRATYNAVPYEIFRGHAEGFPQTYPDGLFNTECTLHAVDGTQYLTQAVIENDVVVARPGKLLKRRRHRRKRRRGPERDAQELELSEYSDLIEYSDPWAYWPVAENSEETVQDVVGGKDLVPKNGAIIDNEDPLAIGESWPSGAMYFTNSLSRFFRTAGVEIPEAKSWTVEALIHMNTLPSTLGTLVRIVSSALDNGNTNPIFNLHINTSDRLVGSVYASNNTFYTATQATAGFIAGVTYHVALVWDSGASILRIYQNGSQVGSAATAAGLTLDPTNNVNIFIGGNPNLAPTGYFDGRIDEVAIFNKILSTTTLVARPNTFASGFASGQTAATRIGACLDRAFWPASWRDINTGTSQTVTGRRYSNQTVLEEIQVTEAANFGRFWFSPDGLATTYERDWRNHADLSTSAATFGDGAGEMPYDSIGALERDDSNLYNRVMAKAIVDANVQRSEDGTSQAAYGVRNLDLGELILDTLSPATTLCSDLLARYKDPQPRFKEITIKPHMQEADLWPKVLGYDLCKHITIKKRPRGSTDTAITQASHIERITHRVPRGGFQASMSDWTTTWTVSPR